MNFEVDPRFTTELPADGETTNVPRQVLGACYSWVSPKEFEHPKCIHIAKDFAKELGFIITPSNAFEFGSYTNGKIPFPGFKTYASCYGGHQFGHWAGQLGDGRAITIAELNIQKLHWTLQLKGSGPTPYSRRGDGFAVLRSSIREYLMSEAMHYLGIPTTRALSLSLTGEQVMRDKHYSGHPALEIGAMVCRVAPHFIRFGSFEILAAQNDLKTLQKLADYTLKQYYPEIKSEGSQKYLDLFKAVSEKCLTTTLHWQRVGFVHGVLNTDNMSITGETIDYGPFGFLDAYDPHWTPNTTDEQHRRYRYEHQPKIVLWNLLQLANALYPLHDNAKEFEAVLTHFQDQFELKSLQMMKEKLGIYTLQDSDATLVNELLALLEDSQVDFSLFFRNLASYTYVDTAEKSSLFGTCSEAFYKLEHTVQNQWERWNTWFYKYDQRLKLEALAPMERMKCMNLVNPKYVLRNYMFQQAIDLAEKEDYSLIEEFYELLQNPYEEQSKFLKWSVKVPRDAGASALSCSS